MPICPCPLIAQIRTRTGTAHYIYAMQITGQTQKADVLNELIERFIDKIVYCVCSDGQVYTSMHIAVLKSAETMGSTKIVNSLIVPLSPFQLFVCVCVIWPYTAHNACTYSVLVLNVQCAIFTWPIPVHTAWSVFEQRPLKRRWAHNIDTVATSHTSVVIQASNRVHRTRTLILLVYKSTLHSVEYPQLSIHNIYF